MKITCKTVVNDLPIAITSSLSSVVCVVNTSAEPRLGGRKVKPRHAMQLQALIKGKQLLGIEDRWQLSLKPCLCVLLKGRFSDG